jgi:tetratricopeptide (TPR) repeat protein
MNQPPTASPPLPDRRRTWAVSFLLFCGTFLLFARAIGHPFLDLDDPTYVTQNHHVQSGFTRENIRWAFTTGDAANWHPLTWLSHMLDWSLYGNNPRGHHATSIFWHSLNAVMAFLALRKLTGAFWPSALAAAIFAWHPLRVESVAWIAERKDVLSVFFGLLTLWTYAAYAQRQRESRTGAWGYYLLTLAALAIGLMFKPTLVTIPFLLLLLDLWPLERLTLNSRPLVVTAVRLILEKIPFFALAIASSIITFRVQKAGGAMIESISLASRLSNSIVSVVEYLKNFFWPLHLSMGYPNPDHLPAATVFGAIVFLSIVTVIGLWQCQKRPWILVGWLWFLGTLVPMIGIVKVGLQGMADRYTYFPMLGIEIAIIWTFNDIANAGRSFNRIVWPAASALVLIACAILTWRQLGIWSTPRSLYEYSVVATPDNYLAECYLGSNLLGDKKMGDERLNEAMIHFERALAIKPDYALARLRRCLVLQKLGRRDEAEAEYYAVLRERPNDPQAEYGLGLLFLNANEPQKAIEHLQISLNAQPDDEGTLLDMGTAQAKVGNEKESIACFEKVIAMFPDHPNPYFEYANALVLFHRDNDAIAHYDKSEQLDPDSELAYVNEANSLRKLGRPADAADRDRKAIAIDPSDAEAYFGLASALDDLQRPDEAIENYAKAVALRPDLGDAQYNLGVGLFNQGHPDQALPHLQAAVHAEPQNDAAFLGLGLCQSQSGDMTGAVISLERAIAINPGNADAHYYLGITYQSMGRNDLAIDQWQQTLRIAPDYAGVADLIAKARATTTAPAPTNP